MLDSLYENSVAQGPTNTELGFPISSDQVAPENPFEMVLFSDDPTCVPSNEISSSNTELETNGGHDDLFFWFNSEAITSNIAPIGLESEHENSLSLPGTGERVPSNDVPIGTEMGHDDQFFWRSSEMIPSNVPLDTETGNGKDAMLQAQGQEISHDCTKNPFGNPFMWCTNQLDIEKGLIEFQPRELRY